MRDSSYQKSFTVPPSPKAFHSTNFKALYQINEEMSRTRQLKNKKLCD